MFRHRNSRLRSKVSAIGLSVAVSVLSFYLLIGLFLSGQNLKSIRLRHSTHENDIFGRRIVKRQFGSSQFSEGDPGTRSDSLPVPLSSNVESPEQPEQEASGDSFPNDPYHSHSNLRFNNSNLDQLNALRKKLNNSRYNDPNLSNWSTPDEGFYANGSHQPPSGSQPPQIPFYNSYINFSEAGNEPSRDKPRPSGPRNQGGLFGLDDELTENEVGSRENYRKTTTYEPVSEQQNSGLAHVINNPTVQSGLFGLDDLTESEVGNKENYRKTTTYEPITKQQNSGPVDLTNDTVTIDTVSKSTDVQDISGETITSRPVGDQVVTTTRTGGVITSTATVDNVTEEVKSIPEVFAESNTSLTSPSNATTKPGRKDQDYRRKENKNWKNVVIAVAVPVALIILITVMTLVWVLVVKPKWRRTHRVQPLSNGHGIHRTPGSGSSDVSSRESLKSNGVNPNNEAWSANGRSPTATPA